MFAVPFARGQQSAASYIQAINRAPTNTSLSLSASIVGPTNPMTLTATVAYPPNGQASGSVTFTAKNGAVVVASNTSSVTTNGQATWTTLLPTGNLTIDAVYSGDSNLLGSTATPAATATVLGPADFKFASNAISVTAGQIGSSVNAVQSLNGFHGPITFTCASPNATIDCNFLPYVFTIPSPIGQIQPSATVGSVAFNVTTLATTVERAGLFGAFLLSCMSLKRRRKYLVLLATAFLCLLVGCGTSTRYLQHDGTPKGTYSMTVTGTSGALSHTQTILVTVK
jgi:hypothetical protein